MKYKIPKEIDKLGGSRMNRLTTIINGYAHGREGRNENSLTDKWCRGEFEATAIVEKLAKYEDAEENGFLVRLPCRVGDTVFEVFENLRWDEDGIEDWFEHEVIKKPFEYSDIPEIGKTVFLTKAEAEAKLKEMEGENGDND